MSFISPRLGTLFGSVLLVCLVIASAQAQTVVINEIMYHPSSHNPREEYIELFNRSATNVNLSGWALKKGVNFTFPTNTILGSSNYLVIAANRQAFTNKYPTVTNVIGDIVVVRVTNVVGFSFTNFQNTLSNTRDDISLEDAAGNTINKVSYADQGDWATRQRGVLDLGYQGWTWFSDADGLGKSMELLNPSLPNDNGQNWRASLTVNGTPGRANSAATNNIAPLVLSVTHSPIIPQATNTVAITAKIIDEASGVTVRAFWRTNGGGSAPAFTSVTMVDDGAHGDGVAGDGIFGAFVPAQPHGTIVEFYVEGVDASNQTNSWPRPSIDLNGASLGHANNALYQVDTNVYSLPTPLHRLIMVPADVLEFSNLLAGVSPNTSSFNSDAAYNCTFINSDSQGTDVRYLCSVRNRGHGSRQGTPHNYRLDFPSDNAWHNVTGLNINARTVHAQIFGSTIARMSGAPGNTSRPLSLRFNAGAPPGGTNAFFAENEVPDSDFAIAHFPNDGKGNVYSVYRDIAPPTFTWRGPNPNSYTNTYFKDSNGSENDFTDIIALSRIMGSNDLFTAANVRALIDPTNWLTHVAVMALFDNRETGLNEAYNDDYEMYRGINDPRMLLLFHDLDTINNEGDTKPNTTTATIFGATGALSGDNGTGAVFNRLMNSPEFQPLYYQTVQRLLNTTFAKTNFDAVMNQTIGAQFPNVLSNMKTWMDGRRSYVQGLLNTYFATNPPPPTATISGEPRSPTTFTTTTLTVGGSNVVSYKYSLNGGAWSAEIPVATAISLSGLANGSSNVVFVIGKSSAGAWQDTNSATLSKPWIVNTTMAAVRLNEILAWNTNAVQHGAVFPDVIELYNEGASSIDLGGLRLSDDAANPNKFTFSSNTVLAANSYLICYANNNDGSGGIHLGFGLNRDGTSVYLFDRGTNNAVLDSVTFGLQLADKSIGRFGNSGDWKLCVPTFGAANSSIALGNLYNVRINEWLASGVAPFVEDFVELYNPDSAPVNIGNCYVTDEPIGAPRLQQMPALTFIAGNGFLKFTADGSKSPRHLNFSLNADQDQISMLDPSLARIDAVMFGAQSSGVSQGRCPDGANNFVSLATPTPGIPNACPVTPAPAPTITLVTISNSWKFEQSGTDLGSAWIPTNYNDSAWQSGPGLLGSASQNGSGTVPEPIRTTLTVVNGKTTFYFRTTFTNSITNAIASFQVNHVIDDGAVFYLNGVEFYRYNMNAGTPSFSTLASGAIANVAQYSGPITVTITNLLPGVNYFAVEVHQSSTTSPDILFGTFLNAVLVTNTPTAAGVVINEVLAKNASLAEADGSTPDWVEFYNPSSTGVDLAGSSLTDDVSNPQRWIFPSGSLVPGKGFLRVFFDSSRPASATNTGYGLKDTGDSVYLFSPSVTLLDSINFGLQAADFSIGRVPTGGTNWALCVPTPTASNTVTTLGDVTQLKVNEWMANPSSGDDYLEIFNPNAQPVALADLWLTDNLSTPSSRMSQQLPKLSFLGTGMNAYQEFQADGAPEKGPNHVNFSLKAGGESVGISLADGTLIDGVTFGAQAVGVSQGRFPDGATNIVSFTVSPSPGEMNWLPLTNIVISEVLSHTDPPLEDAIEIQNTNAASVNINGWFVSDSKQNLKKYPITNALAVPAGGFVVFYETQFNNTAIAPNNFALSSAHGDDVYVSAATNGVLTGYRAHVSFDAAENGTSFGRYRKSTGEFDLTAMSARTFGFDNPSTVQQFRTGTGKTNAYPKVGPVVITEVMYHPVNIGTNDNTRDEFVEIKNVASTNVALYDTVFATNHWRIRGGVSFDLPAVTLAPNATLIVVGFDPVSDGQSAAEFRAAYSLPSNATLFGPWSGKLGNGGDSVELQRPDAPQPVGLPDAGFVPHILVDKVKYSASAPWPTNADGFGMSLQRVSTSGYGNDVTNWFATAPTAAPYVNQSGDSDGDGMPDAWEQAHGLNPYDASDANIDSDGDRMTNLQEYLAGTDPQDPASVLKLSISPTPANAARLSFAAAANVSYTIQYRTNVSSGGWSNLQSISSAPSNRTVSVTNSMAPRFFRVTTP